MHRRRSKWSWGGTELVRAYIAMAGVRGVRTREAPLVSRNRVVPLIYTIAYGYGTDRRTVSQQSDSGRWTAIVRKKLRIQIGIRAGDTAGAAGGLKLQVEPIVPDR